MLAAALFLAAMSRFGLTARAQEDHRDVKLEEAAHRLPEALLRFVTQHGWEGFADRRAPIYLRKLIVAYPLSSAETSELTALYTCCRFSHQDQIARVLLQTTDRVSAGARVEEALIRWWKAAYSDRVVSLLHEVAVAGHNPRVVSAILSQWPNGNRIRWTENDLLRMLDVVEAAAPMTGTEFLGKILEEISLKQFPSGSDIENRALVLLSQAQVRGHQVPATARGQMEAAFLRQFARPEMDYRVFLAAIDFASRSGSEAVRERVALQLHYGELSGTGRMLAEATVGSTPEEILRSRYVSLRQKLVGSNGMPDKTRSELSGELEKIETEMRSRKIAFPKDRFGGNDDAPEHRVPRLARVPAQEALVESWIRRASDQAQFKAKVELEPTDFLNTAPEVTSDRRRYNFDPGQKPANIRVPGGILAALARVETRMAEIHSILRLEEADRVELFRKILVDELARTFGDPAIDGYRGRNALLDPRSAEFQETITAPLKKRVLDSSETLYNRHFQALVPTAPASPKSPVPAPEVEIRDAQGKKVGSMRIQQGPAGLQDLPFLMNVTEAARRGEFDPILGRDEELRQIETTLLRRDKGSAFIIGEPGVGKTALVYELARRLSDFTILQVDLNEMEQGTKYRGAFEERVSDLIKFLSRRSNMVLFIDEVHQAMAAGGVGESKSPLIEALKPLLASWQIRLIGATDIKHFRRVEEDTALLRRARVVEVREPSVAEALEMAKLKAPKYEKFHQVEFDPEAIESAVRLSKRYLTDRRLPDAAIDVLDEAAARKRLGRKTAESKRISRPSTGLGEKRKSGRMRISFGFSGRSASQGRGCGWL